MSFDRGPASSRRELVARALLHLAHAPPITCVTVLLAPLVYRLERAGTRSRAIWWWLRCAYYVGVLGFAVLVQLYIPYLSRGDLVHVAWVAVLVVVVTRVRARSPTAAVVPDPVVRTLLLASGLAFAAIVNPPLPLSAIGRLWLAAIFAGAVLVVAVIGGGSLMRPQLALALVVALANGGVRLRQWVFYNVTAGSIAERVERTAGVRVLPVPLAGFLEGVRDSPTIAINWNHLGGPLMESCDGGSYLMGQLGRTLRIPLAGGSEPLERLDVGFSRICWLECGPNVLHLGNTSIDGSNEIVDVGFSPLRVLRRTPHCTDRAPDTVRADPARQRAWWVDDTGGVSGFDLARFACAESVPGDFARDLAIDPRTGDLFVLDMGRLRRFSRSASAYVAEVALPAPSWALASTRVGHRLGQLAYDADHDRLFATDMNTGVLAVLRASDLAVERWMPLGLGIRHLALDSRHGRLFVGNFLTGEMVVLDATGARELGRIDVGPRIQALTLSRDGRRLSFINASSGVVVDLDVLVLDAATPDPR